MRRILGLASLVGLLSVTMAGPAGAAPAEKAKPTKISPDGCSAAGGAFTKAAGTRTCTFVSIAEVDGALVEARFSHFTTSFPGGSYRAGLIGTSYRQTTVETTVSRSQVGRQTITETVAVRELSSVQVAVSCIHREESSQSGFYDRSTGQYVEGIRRVTETPGDFTPCAIRDLFIA